MNKIKMDKLIDSFPIIAAIKNDDGLEKCLSSDCKIVFVLYGNINTISDIVGKLKKYDKTVFVHTDLIEGLSAKEASIDYLLNNTSLDGIISTKVSLLKFAKAKGLLTILRFFVIDSLALSNISKNKDEKCIDFIEILPGLMPKVTKTVIEQIGKRVITGGLVTDKSDILTSLEAGACGVSSTNADVWFM